MKSTKIFVSSGGTATIGCPECGLTKQVPVERYLGKKHTIKIRCACEHSFQVYLEFRSAYRKNTDLEGTYRILTNGEGGGYAFIQNISRGGIGFSAPDKHTIQIGQKVQLDFTLDNPKKTRLSREVVIRSVTSNSIGCEFSGQQAFEKDLGFYLQS